jgi:TRAP transporter TAXI family solute receptor
MEFSHQWGPQAADAIRGIGLYDKSPKPNLRFLFNLAPSPITPMTRADANIKTLKDLKGKRMLLGFPPSPVLTKVGELYLSAAGLTRDDIMALPIETGPKGNRAMIEGTAQAWIWPYSPGTAALKDMGRAIDLYIVPPTPKELAWMIRSMPGALPYKVKAGAMPGVSKDITILGMQAITVANKNLPESLGYELMKVLFDNLGDLRGYHPQFKWMKLETAARNPVMPYHTGAIKFYKERGLWTGELEEAHQKLLKEISR